MAETLVWLGDAGTDYATVMVKAMTAGTVSMTGATNDGPFAVDPAVNCGICKFTVSGLAADSRYSLAILHGGSASSTITARTMPASGSFTFGFGSCLHQAAPQHWAYQLVRDHDIRAWFALGDTPYCDEGVTPYHAPGGVNQGRWMVGATTSSCYANWTQGRVAYDNTYENLQRTPGWKFLTERVPTYRMPDDHEYGNDWDWSVDKAGNFSPAISTQADVDTVGHYANLSLWDWNSGNPSNADAELGNWKPSSCADSATLHPPKYYRKTIGDVEFFHIDCYAHLDADSKSDAHRKVCINNATWNAETGYTYSDPSGAALAKTRLGPYQLNWLLTHVLASTAKFKVIVSGKTTHAANSDTDNHGWAGYAQERDYILRVFNLHARGVLWLAGDVHTASVVDHQIGCVCVNSSPLGQNLFFGDGGVWYYPGYTDGMIWRTTGNPGGLVTSALTYNKNSYGVVYVTTDYLNPRIYSESGELLWQGYLREDSNRLEATAERRYQLSL